VVAERYAAEIAILRDELPDLEHVRVRDSEYESRLARQSAVGRDWFYLNPPPAPGDSYLHLALISQLPCSWWRRS
jgi:hypothetical protein